MTLIAVGIPYILFGIVIELFKTQLSTISWHSVLGYGIALLLTAVIAIFFKKGKRAVFKTVRNKLSKKR